MNRVNRAGEPGEPSSNRGEPGEPSDENRAQASPVEWGSKILARTFHFNPTVVLEGRKETWVKNKQTIKKTKHFQPIFIIPPQTHELLKTLGYF